MKLLNLGCGSRYLPNWTNLDFVSTGPGVVAHNLLEGIPFPNDSFDVVYNSHVLEHFSKEQAIYFIQECYRVLKPSGVLRIATPDLEQIARIYLQQMEKVLSDANPLNKANYDWAVIEMFDQAVRHKSGGDMAAYWRQPELINQDWIETRMGDEFLAFRNSIARKRVRSVNDNVLLRWIKSFRKKVLIWLSNEPRLFEYLALGRFRLGGEIHQWMYDRYSLFALLKESGFRTVKQMDAHTSLMNDWDKFQWLDMEAGKVRKPDSIFMEAIK